MKKIMFSDRFGLTEAVLEGRKTQTRRIINPQPEHDKDKGMLWKGVYSGIGFDNPKDAYKNFSHHSRYKTGEVVAVAQSYNALMSALPGTDKRWINIVCNTSPYEAGRKNKMFVKSGLMLHLIMITEVKLQQLRDITDEECLSEGIEKEARKDGGYNYIFFDAKRDLHVRERTPRDAYARLIDALSGKGTWESNPYVFACSFKLIK